MANKKFSEFTVITDPDGLQVVGLKAGDNVRITWASLLAILPFIPLSGTEVGKPVTGDVEVSAATVGSQGFKLYTGDIDATGNAIRFTDDGFIELLSSQIGLGFQSSIALNPVSSYLQSSNSIGTKSISTIIGTGPVGIYVKDTEQGIGLSGEQDFTPNIGPLDYVQYKLLPKVADNYADDAAAAVGGIAVGAMYHTAGVVKIRLS